MASSFYTVGRGRRDFQSVCKPHHKKAVRLRSHNYNGEYAFRVGLTWTSLSISSISVRYSPTGFLFDSKGAMGFCNNRKDLRTAIADLEQRIANASAGERVKKNYAIFQDVLAKIK